MPKDPKPPKREKSGPGREWLLAPLIEGQEKIVAEIEEMQEKLDAQSAAIAQAGTDLQELIERVEGQVDPTIDALKAEIETLTTERDALSAELGADHSAVAAMTEVIANDTAAVTSLSAVMDEFRAAATA